MWPALNNLTHSVTLTLPQPHRTKYSFPDWLPSDFTSDEIIFVRCKQRVRFMLVKHLLLLLFFLSESPPLWPVLMWEMEINNRHTSQEYYATALSALPLKRFKKTAKVCLNDENKWNTRRSLQWKMINQRPPPSIINITISFFQFLNNSLGE